MNIKARGLKKLLCNPPAERQAAEGDSVLLGMFEAAGEAWERIDDEKLQAEFLKKVTEVEAQYLRDRNVVRTICEAAMQSAFDKLLKGYE